MFGTVVGCLSRTLAEEIDSVIAKGVTAAITGQLHTACAITVVDVSHLISQRSTETPS